MLRPTHLLLVPALLFGACVSSKSIRETPGVLAPVRSASFAPMMSAVTASQWTNGNRLTVLENGDQILPAMLAAIRSAKKTITFETYVFEKGEVPEAFAKALAERARAGVEVRVTVDAHGGKKSRPYHQEMRDAGVAVEIYHGAWRGLTRYNHRTHRKLLVVDGKTGFIGGVGIADQWAGNAESAEHWRDLHFRVEGPVVGELQGTFMDNWLKHTGTLLAGPGYFPPLQPAGSVRAAVFASAPEQGNRNLQTMDEIAINSARRSLLIENAYFVPDNLMMESLIAAAQRGVRIRIILPGDHIDQKAVRRSAKPRIRKLAKEGIEIFEYQPTMIHTKLLVADGLFVSVGSGNLDFRSLTINDEANLNVLDAGFATRMERIFERDLRECQPAVGTENVVKSAVETPVHTAQKPVESQL